MKHLSLWILMYEKTESLSGLPLDADKADTLSLIVSGTKWPSVHLLESPCKYTPPPYPSRLWGGFLRIPLPPSHEYVSIIWLFLGRGK